MHTITQGLAVLWKTLTKCNDLGNSAHFRVSRNLSPPRRFFQLFYRQQKEKQFAQTAAAWAIFGSTLSNAEGICWATLKVCIPQDLIKETQVRVLFCKRYIPQKGWACLQRKLITAMEQNRDGKCFEVGNTHVLLPLSLVTPGLQSWDHKLCLGFCKLWGTGTALSTVFLAAAHAKSLGGSSKNSRRPFRFVKSCDKCFFPLLGR